MHTFFLDLWHDLREKRLWPVAALLLVGIAAVPFVLLEKEQPAPAPVNPPTKAETASDKLPTIALDDVSTAAPSDLSEFDQRNPFKPLADLPTASEAAKKGDKQTVDLGESPGGSSQGGSAGGSAGGSGGSGSEPASSAGGSAGGSGGGPAGGPGGSTAPTTTYYAYRADIRFGVAGNTKAMKQVKAFTLLGDDKAPAALFMGVTDDHDYAVFAVDAARFEADGEHECKPTPQRCEFVYLKTADSGNETSLTTLDGETSYDLELTAIKRVTLDKADVEDVPTEDDKSAGKDAAAPAPKDKVVEPALRSMFDILAQRR